MLERSMKRMAEEQFEVVEKVSVCVCLFCVILLVYVCVHRKRLKCKHFAETYFAAGKWEYMRAGTVFTNSLVLV